MRGMTSAIPFSNSPPVCPRTKAAEDSFSGNSVSCEQDHRSCQLESLSKRSFKKRVPKQSLGTRAASCDDAKPELEPLASLREDSRMDFNRRCVCGPTMPTPTTTWDVS